jgi:hypothetical protein
MGGFARSSALICGRRLAGESATRRGSGWCRMALYRQLTTSFGAKTEGPAGSPKAAFVQKQPRREEAVAAWPGVRGSVQFSFIRPNGRDSTGIDRRHRARPDTEFACRSGDYTMQQDLLRLVDC